MRWPFVLLLLTPLSAQTPKLVADIHPRGNSNPTQAESIRGWVLFQADDGKSGRELWRTDGTRAGTTLVKDLVPGPGHGDPAEMRRLGNKILFAAWTSKLGRELWVSDGTPRGTMLLKDLQPGPASAGIAGISKPVNGRVFFAAHASNGGGAELWVSDGTAAGTKQVADIRPGNGGSNPFGITQLPGTQCVVFSAYTDATGAEPWISDGTAKGTRLIRDIYPGKNHGVFSYFAPVGDKLFFSGASAAHGLEPWITDGTAQGTRLLVDLCPGVCSSRPDFVVSSGKVAYFRAATPAVGGEVFMSDGTASGTRLLKDIARGSRGSSPYSLTPLGSRGVMFTATDPTLGTEPWISDGTTAGTRMLADINPGSASSSPWMGYLREFGHNGRTFFFSALNPGSGRELWKVDLDRALSWRVESGCGMARTVPMLNGSDPVLGKTMTLLSDHLKAGTIGALIASAPSEQRIPKTGCTLFAWPPVLIVDAWVQTGRVTRTSTLPIPKQASLAGVQLSFQTWNLTPSTWLDVSMSNGFVGLLGK